MEAQQQTSPSTATFSPANPQFFFEVYKEGGSSPAWVIDKPQRALVDLHNERKDAQDGFRFEGPVLDLGCGTGDNAIFFAEAGYETLGVDFVPEAIKTCNKKKSEKQVHRVEFIVGDATRLETYPEVTDRQWRIVIDSALFHVFDDETRIKYVDSLNKILPSKSHLVLLCFSDAETRGNAIPRRVTKGEIESNFSNERGWTVKDIRSTTFQDTRRGEAYAWLAIIQKN